MSVNFKENEMQNRYNLFSNKTTQKNSESSKKPLSFEETLKLLGKEMRNAINGLSSIKTIDNALTLLNNSQKLFAEHNSIHVYTTYLYQFTTELERFKREPHLQYIEKQQPVEHHAITMRAGR